MRFFNILLKSNETRIQNSNRLREHIPQLEIFPAVEGKTNQLEFLLEDRIIHPDFLQFCKRGELACLLSHLSLWKKMVKDNIDEAVVLEDDAIVSHDFLDTLNGLYNDLPENTEFVYLFIHPDSKKPAFSISNNLSKGYSTYGTVAYYMTLNIARELINVFSININRPLDETISWFLDRSYTKYYCVSSNLVETNGKIYNHDKNDLSSVIGETGKFNDADTKVQFTYYLDEGEYRCYPCCDLEENLFYDETLDLKSKYLEDENVVAFNSDGWIKKYPSKWTINLKNCIYIKSSIFI